MALKETTEARRERRTPTGAGDFVAYARTVTCPKADAARHLAVDLVKGSILPDAWRDAPAATDENAATAPLLQSVTRGQQRGGAMDEFTLEYVAVLPRST